MKLPVSPPPDLISQSFPFTRNRFSGDEIVDDDTIDEVRTRILASIDRCCDEVDECDMELIRETDDMIFRSILHQRHIRPREQSREAIISVATDAVIHTLKWRHDFGINSMRDEDTPREMFQAKGVLHYMGSNGRFFVYMKMSKFKRFSSIWMDFGIRFTLHEIDKRMKEFAYRYKRGVHELSPILIFDARGMGVSQIDLKYSFIARSIFLSHYPKSFAEMWIYGTPWWARPLLELCFRVMPSYVTNNLKLMDTESMIRCVGAENIPISLGGKLEENYLSPPENATTIEEVGRKIGASKSETRRVIAHLRSVIE